MGDNRIHSIVHFTEELHDDTTEIFEAMADGEDPEAIKIIDGMIRKLRDFKSTIVKIEEA